MIKTKALIFLISLLLSHSLWAVDIKVGVLHFPPFYILEEDQPVKGVYAELTRNILDKAGLSYTITGYPPKRFYQNLGLGVTNLFIGVKGSKLIEGKVSYSNTVLRGLELRSYFRTRTVPAKSKEDLKNQSVIIIRGFGYGGLIRYLQDPANNIHLVVVGSHKTAFKMLQAGRGEYLLNYRESAEQALDGLDFDNLNYKVISQIPAYFILNNQLNNKGEIMSRLEKAYHDLRKNGEIPDYSIVD